MGKPLVSIVMGSANDWEIMQQAAQQLKDFGVAFDARVISAHRSPDLLFEYIQEMSAQGVQCFIAGAGGAAHLAGVLAAHTPLPVIGVPLAPPAGAAAMGGLDALLATVQMPAGVPVATVAIGGARNAALLAVQILATADDELRGRYRAYKSRLAREVEDKAARIAAAAPSVGMAPRADPGSAGRDGGAR